MKRKCVVTVIESLSETSMPLNEFVLYRHKHAFPYRQILIVCSNNTPQGLRIPDQIEVKYVGRNILRMRSALKELKYQCRMRKEYIVFHLHAYRSSMIFFASSVGLGLKSRTVFTIHSTFQNRNLKYRVLCSLCALLSNKVYCVSGAAYLGFSRIIKRLKGSNVGTITNGVDVDRIDHILKDCGRDDHKEKRIVCVGRLIPIKNQQFLIRLLPLLPDVRLILIGKGPSKHLLEKLACQMNVNDRVTFTGLITREEVYSHLMSCDVYVSASIVEGMPISVLEAMSIGLYPILSDIPSHKEIMDKCGLSPLPLRTEMWIESISQFFKIKKDDKRVLMSKITQIIRESYSLTAMHQAYDDVYDQLLS